MWLLLFSLLWHPAARACSCAAPDLVSFYERASTVVLLIGGERAPPKKYRGPSRPMPREYEFDVIDVFKGDVTFDRLHSSGGGAMCGGHISKGRPYLIAPDQTGGFMLCSDYEIGPDPDLDPAVRALRAHAAGRIATLTNPWRFSDDGGGCQLRHRLSREAQLNIIYRYAAAKMDGTVFIRENDPENVRERKREMMRAGYLGTQVFVSSPRESTDRHVRVVAGSTSVEAHPDVLARHWHQSFETLDRNGTLSLLDALKDGGDVHVHWRQDPRRHLKPESDEPKSMVATTPNIFLDGALDKFAQCMAREPAAQLPGQSAP